MSSKLIVGWTFAALAGFVLAVNLRRVYRSYTRGYGPSSFPLVAGILGAVALTLLSSSGVYWWVVLVVADLASVFLFASLMKWAVPDWRERRLRAMNRPWVYRSREELVAAGFKYVKDGRCPMAQCGAALTYWTTPENSVVSVDKDTWKLHRDTCKVPRKIQMPAQRG